MHWTATTTTHTHPEDNSNAAIYRNIMKSFDELIISRGWIRRRSGTICSNCGQIILVLLTGFPTQRCCSLVGSRRLHRGTLFPPLDVQICRKVCKFAQLKGGKMKCYTHFVTMNARTQGIFIDFFLSSITSVCLDLTQTSRSPLRACASCKREKLQSSVSIRVHKNNNNNNNNNFVIITISFIS